MKNKFITILITLIFPLSVFALDENLVPIEEPMYAEQTVENADNFHSQEIEDIQNIAGETKEQQLAAEEKNNLIPHKQPISKKKLIKKFFKAMFFVGICALTIYLGLSFYKRFKEGDTVQIKTPEGKTPLSEPDDLEGAVDIFLDKTKWV